MISGVIANWDIISRKYKLINKEINFSWRLFELLNWQFTVRCKITTQNTKFRLLNTNIFTYLSVSKRFSLSCFKNLNLCLLHADVSYILQCDNIN